MDRQSYDPTWAFLSVLVCLFVLAAAMPRAWQKLTRQKDPVEQVTPSWVETPSEDCFALEPAAIQEPSQPPSPAEVSPVATAEEAVPSSATPPDEATETYQIAETSVPYASRSIDLDWLETGSPSDSLSLEALAAARPRRNSG